MLQVGVALISMVLNRTCFFGTEGRRSLREGEGLGGPESGFEAEREGLLYRYQSSSLEDREADLDQQELDVRRQKQTHCLSATEKYEPVCIVSQKVQV